MLTTLKKVFKKERFPADFTEEEIAIFKQVEPYTETSRERVYSLIQAVRHVTQHSIPGSLVECGVFKGGSSMAMALSLLNHGVTNRDLYLFDTFEGMPQPTQKDVSYKGSAAADVYEHRDSWSYCSLEDVRSAFSTIPYPSERVHYIKGMVETTIPEKAPQQIALLRLDTDWYESTKHELEHLFPRLTPGGILIIDDYGHWRGAREAVDEYLATHQIPLFLQRIDYTGRIAVKPMYTDRD